MDFVLDQATQHGMRVIVALTDYWKVTDGVQQVKPTRPAGEACEAASSQGIAIGCLLLQVVHSMAEEASVLGLKGTRDVV